MAIASGRSVRNNNELIVMIALPGQWGTLYGTRDGVFTVLVSVVITMLDDMEGTNMAARVLF